MAIFKKYALIVLVFALDIVSLGYCVIRQLDLPSRRRRGNLLSSLFTFTVGLLERLIHFEKEILVKPVLFGNRYIRQGLQVAPCLSVQSGRQYCKHLPGQQEPPRLILSLRWLIRGKQFAGR